MPSKGGINRGSSWQEQGVPTLHPELPVWPRKAAMGSVREAHGGR